MWCCQHLGGRHTWISVRKACTRSSNPVFTTEWCKSVRCQGQRVTLGHFSPSTLLRGSSSSALEFSEAECQKAVYPVCTTFPYKDCGFTDLLPSFHPLPILRKGSFNVWQQQHCGETICLLPYESVEAELPPILRNWVFKTKQAKNQNIQTKNPRSWRDNS